MSCAIFFQKIREVAPPNRKKKNDGVMGVMGAKKERRNFTTRSPSDVAAWATRSLNHSN